MKKYLFLFFWSGAVIFFCACKKEQVIPVKASFGYEIVDDNHTVPVTIKITNTSTGATHYKWTFQDGSPSSSIDQQPQKVTFHTAGTHVIKLEVWNSDKREEKIITIKVDSLVNNLFEAHALINNFAPAQVEIVNKTTGGTSFKWSFAGGLPASSDAKNPGIIAYTQPGEYTITLEVSNGSKTYSSSQKINIEVPLQPIFTIVPSFEDADYEAPLKAELHNTTLSGLTYKWSASGGVISNPTAYSPTIYFDNPGDYTVILEASNGKEIKTYSQTIQVLPNTNIFTFSDVKFGINTAKDLQGAYFSSSLKRIIRANEELSGIGKNIDIVFFGLNSDFTHNKFIAPMQAADYTFGNIPQAQDCKIVNMPSMAGYTFSVADFESMKNDKLLQSILITDSDNAYFGFSPSHIVLFRTADGRKGVIKVKEFVNNGLFSYILTDIKIQKQGR